MKKILLGLLLSLLATPLIAQFDSQTAQSTSMGWSEGRSIVRDVAVVLHSGQSILSAGENTFHMWITPTCTY